MFRNKSQRRNRKQITFKQGVSYESTTSKCYHASVAPPTGLAVLTAEDTGFAFDQQMLVWKHLVKAASAVQGHIVPESNRTRQSKYLSQSRIHTVPEETGQNLTSVETIVLWPRAPQPDLAKDFSKYFGRVKNI